MSTFIGFALGILTIGLLWLFRAKLATARTSATPVAGSAALDRAPALSPDPPLVQLQKMTAELDRIGEASAHPKDLVDNETFRNAVALMRSDAVPITTVADYANGANWMLSAVAYAALCERPDRAEVAPGLTAAFRHIRPWPMHFALQYVLGLAERTAAGALLLQCPEWWADNIVVPGLFAEHFAQRADLGDAPGFGDALQRLQPKEVESAEALLRNIQHPSAAQLLEQLSRWRTTTLDRTYLQSFGRFWESDLDQELLVEHEAVSDQLAIAGACIHHAPPRSILAVGDPRTGKTAFLRLLAARCMEQGWSVFEAGAASLMAGQEYIGQLEERLRRIATELAAEKRVLWYVPDLLQLAMSGTHRSQAASILDQIFPAIASGKIIVISETTSSGLTNILQRKPALRSAVEIIRLRPLGEPQLQKLVSDFGERMTEVLGIAVADGTIDAAIHMARYYLGADQMPGAVLDLLKLGAQYAVANGADRLEREHLLATLSQQTGMPRSVLDDRERVDLGQMREFFSRRLIGQREAVAVVVDRIAMLKAGLTDPTRPIGVFLFAGPTGTGKTELAKTLAAYLFGAADRLVRLDMSEFQHSEAARKILGDAHDPDAESLTQRIRKQPFAVVLLDEFEKAHPSIWDLFLQVFDDGRLTDAAGRTADFRHAIIILTSNLGATAHQSAGLGFAPSASAFSNEQVMRAVNQSFRPEFVNRLDNVIVFKPLTRDLMRGILAKELQRVVERRGLRHREWAIEWESSALEFLLDKGFSPAMGARPLKRAIDQHVLAPLAATMVEHRFPQGDQFLFVRSDGNGIQVEFVDPDAPSDPSAFEEAPVEEKAGPTLQRIALRSEGTAEEFETLDTATTQYGALPDRPDWKSLHTQLTQQMAASDFWDREDRQRVLARYALMDRVGAAIATAARLRDRLARSASAQRRYSRDLAVRLAQQLVTIEHGVLDALTDAPQEVVLAVQPALDHGADAGPQGEWCLRLVDMYRQWARSRRMQLSEHIPSGATTPWLVIGGFGAHRVLSGESGLHVLEKGPNDDERNRTVARVRVAATPLTSATRKDSALAAVLDASSTAATIVRRYRLSPSPLVRDARRGWRTGRAELVLAGHFDIIPQLSSEESTA